MAATRSMPFLLLLLLLLYLYAFPPLLAFNEHSVNKLLTTSRFGLTQSPRQDLELLDVAGIQVKAVEQGSSRPIP